MKKSGLLAAFIVLCTATTLSFAAAAEPVAMPTPEYVHIKLYPTVDHVTPGQPFDVIIEQLIEPDWHTYWVNPGDSGVSMTATWDFPDGGTASDIRYPTPSRIAFGPLTNFGYANRALYAVTITPPADLTGKTYHMTANLDWLVCHDICLPEGGAYAINLKVGAGNKVNTAVNDVVRDVTLSQPVDTNWFAAFYEDKGKLKLSFMPTKDNEVEVISSAKSHEFFPIEWGLIKNTGTTKLVRPDDGSKELVLSYDRGDRKLADVASSKMLIVATDENGTRRGYMVNAVRVADAAAAAAAAENYEPHNAVLPPAAKIDEQPVTPTGPNGEMPASTASVAVTPVPTAQPGFWGIMGLAVLGGMILNLMPCVFPVLSLKILSIAQLSGHDARRMRRHGLVYMGGVIAMFVIIAGILMSFQAAGSAIGWGFQLQDPLVVTLLAYLFVVMGFNLLGWFEFDLNRYLPARVHHLPDNAWGSFATGMLATIVATPCTAPFMGAAVGYALTQSAFTGLVVFTALGFGLALPFVLLTFIPRLRKILPRPGAWMLIFRQVLAFPMFITSIWLVWVLTQQTGADGAGLALMGALALGAILWLHHHRTTHPRMRIVWWITLALTILGLLDVTYKQNQLTIEPMVTGGQENGITPFTAAALDTALAGNRPVFVNMTAAWCITCKLNEQVAIGTDATQDIFAARNVVYLKGDWTNQNAEITAYLAQFNRKGVPLYVYYAPPTVDGKRPAPLVLPQLLSEKIMRKTFLTSSQETTK